jgi:hypothetical protein
MNIYCIESKKELDFKIYYPNVLIYLFLSKLCNLFC